MIKDGFLYLAALIFAAAVLVNLPKIFKGKKAQVFFNFAPPIVLIYLGLMLLCTMKVWDLRSNFVNRTWILRFVCNIPPALRRRFMESARCTVRKLDGRRRQYARNPGGT